MIGETIKDFTITAQLGRGGMGEVFVGEQRLIKTKVAIKMLLPAISADKAHVDRFFNEAIAVSKIHHAGIVKIFDVGFHEGRAYLVMEFLAGETLAHRLRTPLPFASAIEIGRQVTSVLDATHAAGIIHRDLKPDNIFLVPDAELGERVRILDFGIAKLGDVAATAASMSMGTPAYMPPELWKDAATSGPSTDVYALGCILFELWCGRPPFIVTAIPEACGKHLSEIPPRLHSLRPELPAALDDLIARMLEKAQPDRPTTKQVANLLASLATQRDLGASPDKHPSGIEATMPSGGAGAAGSSGTAKSSGSIAASGSPRTAIGHDADLGALPRDAAISDEDPALVTRYETGGRWMDAVKLLAKLAEAVAVETKPALYLRIASIYHDRFANMAEAIKAYERVLEYESDNRKALDQLRALYEKRRDWEKLLDLEKGELDRTEPGKRADKAVEVARLAASRVGKPDVTIYWWQRVLEYEPDHRQALAELAKSFERGERWVDLCSVLQHQSDVAPGNDDQISALQRIALIQSEKLSDLHAARDSWQHILDLDPTHAAAKKALANLDGDSHRETAKSETAPAKPAAARSSVGPASAADTGLSGSTRDSSIAPHSTRDPGTSGSSRDPESRSSGSSADSGGAEGPGLKIALGLAVLAITGGAIYFAARSSSKPAELTRDLGTNSPRLLQVLADGHIPYTIVNGRVFVAQDAPDIQIVAEVDNGSANGGSANGGSANGGSANSGSANGGGSAAQASGLTLSYRMLSRPATGGDFHVVKPDEQLHTDDRIAFEVKVSESAHVYISQRPKAKALSVVFPTDGVPITNPLPGETWIRIPSGDRSFRLDANGVGLETVYLIAARRPLAALAAAIASEGKAAKPTRAVEDQVVAVAMENRNDCAERGRDIVLDGDGSCKVRPRGIVLDDETTGKPAHRVRGMTTDDAVFIPFSFQHVAH